MGDFLGGGEDLVKDLMEDSRDQNSDDLEADEQLSSSKARLEKYLQKQWQLGKRKLQVQVDFGNVPLEWEYLNQYHGVRHPLAMTAFGPKYGLAGPPSPSTTMAMALSNKDVHRCHRRSSVHKHLAFGNSPYLVLLLLCSSLRQHNGICLGLYTTYLCRIVIKLEHD